MALQTIRQKMVKDLDENLSYIKDQIATFDKPVRTFSDLPLDGNDNGDMRVVLDEGRIYVWLDTEWIIPDPKLSEKYSKTIFKLLEDESTTIHTGIRLDGTGEHQTESEYVNLHYNGQLLINDMNYVSKNVDGEIVLELKFTPEIEDVLAITYGGKILLPSPVTTFSSSNDLENLTVDILPHANSELNIGSPERRFKGIYVDEAYLSTNTLYLGDTPVMGTEMDTINIKADPGQSINIKTTTDGSTKVTSESLVELSTSGMNADVNLKASGVGSKVNITADQQVNFTSKDINFDGNTRIGNLTVEGNLSVNGTTTTVNTQVLQVKDNIIEINKGEIGNGVTSGSAGLKVDRGDLDPYFVIFDEADDLFKVGLQSSLQAIATREWVLANGGSGGGSEPGNNPTKADQISVDITTGLPENVQLALEKHQEDIESLKESSYITFNKNEW